MHTVTTSSGILLATYSYNANGLRTATDWGSGVRTEYTYNVAGLATSVVNRRGAEILSRFEYVYHLDGNTHRVTETMGGVTRVVTYAYDTARRLINEHDTGSGTINRAYTFDVRGNRTQMVVTGAEAYTVTYTYDLNNRLLTEVRTGSNAQTATLSYDRNGNQLTRTAGGVTETRTYDAFNRLMHFSIPGTTSSYTYRADGLRHSQTVNGVRTYHTWDWGNMSLERNAADGVLRRYRRCFTGRLLKCTRNEYYLYNARGDVVQRTDEQGNVIMTYRYSAFGSEIETTKNGGNGSAGSVSTNRFRFAGEYWDSHRGEYYLRARSFNPRTGRFSQPDPFWNIGNMQTSPNAIAQAGNLFVFTMNNPVRWIDPTGLFAQEYLPMPVKPYIRWSLRNSPNVLLDYVMTKYNAANPNSNFSFTTSNHWFWGERLHLTIGGTTGIFAIDAGGGFNPTAFRVSGMMAFSSYILMSYFGLSSEMAIHQPGDVFSSTSTAALAWSMTYWGASNAAGVEFGSNIYSHSGGGYFFGTPISGTATGVDIPPLTAGHTRAAFVHSHPRQGFFMNIWYNMPPGQLNHISHLDRQTSLIHGVPIYAAGPTQIRRYMHGRTTNRRGDIIHRSRRGGGGW